MPFAYAQVILTKRAYIQLKWDAHYWQAEWQRLRIREQEALQRVAELKAQLRTEREQAQARIAELEGQIRDLRQQLFGQSSEKQRGANDTGSRSKSRRNRGQQRGQGGHGRSGPEPHLPVLEQEVDLAEEAKRCPCCGLSYEPLASVETSDVIEVSVRAYVRRVRRKRYRRTCQCPTTPALISAPPPARLIPKGKLGISVWVEILLDKYAYGRPTHRLLRSLRDRGLRLAPGTITGGLHLIAPLLAPVVEALRQHLVDGERWHVDETRWMVWNAESVETHRRWYLWVFVSPTAALYCVDPSRSAQVPKGVLGKAEGIVICDRYSAYKKLQRECPDLLLAFCWSHVRRDFLKVARKHPVLERWSLAWVRRIRGLYRLNERRLTTLAQPEPFTKQDQRLKKLLAGMHTRCNHELNQPHLPLEAKKVLLSLRKHWQGLCVFADHPQVPMDNNEAERALRDPVVGRKNFYGSGSAWSGQLAAWMFSLLMTLNLWKINPYLWLVSYLEAWATNANQPPVVLTPYLPWTLTEQQLTELRNHGPPNQDTRDAELLIGTTELNSS
jgi:transposase